MKKFIYFLALNVLCLAHLTTQATDCAGGFLKRLKQSVSSRSSQKPLSMEASQEALLIKELKDNDVFIQSLVNPSTQHMHFYGNGFLPQYHSERPKGLVKYSAFYVPGKDIKHPKNETEFNKGKGHFFLSMSIILDGEAHYTYNHWIHWPSQAKGAQLGEHTVREIFNEIYKTVYGQTLEWMIASNIFSKGMDHIEKNNLSQFDVYDMFNFNALFFKTKEQQLKSIVTKIIGEATGEHLHQIRPTSKEQLPILIPPAQMMYGLRRVILESYSIEQLKTISSAEIKELPVQDIVKLFNTTEKIQTVDMSLLPPEVQVQLLTEYPLWRESITPNQVQQLDTSSSEIQHVIAPTTKYFVRRPEAEKKKISIDTFTDAQIEKMNRDTFLRDIFLAGELSANGVVPIRVAMFMVDRKQEVQKHGRSVIMKKFIPKKMHDFITQWLGFPTEFESMTTEQKRELFKAERDMMINAPQEKAGMMIKSNQQLKLLEAVIEANEREGHNWF